MTRPAVLLFGLALASYAAEISWQPVTGYVMDSRTGSLRPINGLPGASALGPALALPFALGQVQVCAGKDFALAIEARDSKPGARGSKIEARDSGQIWVIRGLHSGNVNTTKLEGAFADAIQLNASGSAALLYSKASASAQFLTGLPDQPSASKPISLAGTAGTVTAMALSSDANTALLGFSDPATGGVYLLTQGAFGPALVTTAMQPIALALFNGDHDVVVADVAANEVFLIRSIQAVPGRQPLLSAQDGLQQPVGVGVTGDRNLFVADAGVNAIFEMDLTTGLLSDQLPVPGAPSRIDPLALPDAFALTEVGTGQLLLLDTSQQPKVLFVPRN